MTRERIAELKGQLPDDHDMDGLWARATCAVIRELIAEVERLQGRLAFIREETARECACIAGLYDTNSGAATANSIRSRFGI